MKITLILFTSILFISCASDSDIYKTKSGEYGSREGKFIVKFPSEPKSSTIDNQIGLDKFQINLYRSTFGVQEVYSVEYTDYPEYAFASKPDAEVLEEMVQSMSNKLGSEFELAAIRETEGHDPVGRRFLYETRGEVDPDKPYIIGKVFKKGNRIYTVTFSGKDNNRVAGFIDSFRITE